MSKLDTALHAVLVDVDLTNEDRRVISWAARSLDTPAVQTLASLVGRARLAERRALQDRIAAVSVRLHDLADTAESARALMDVGGIEMLRLLDMDDEEGSVVLVSDPSLWWREIPAEQLRTGDVLRTESGVVETVTAVRQTTASDAPDHPTVAVHTDHTGPHRCRAYALGSPVDARRPQPNNSEPDQRGVPS